MKNLKVWLCDFVTFEFLGFSKDTIVGKVNILNTKQFSSKGISKQTSLFWNPLASELFCICKIFNNLNIWDWVDYSYFVIDALDTWESEARTEDMAERRNGHDQQAVIEDTDQWRSELSHTFIHIKYRHRTPYARQA